MESNTFNECYQRNLSKGIILEEATIKFLKKYYSPLEAMPSDTPLFRLYNLEQKKLICQLEKDCKDLKKDHSKSVIQMCIRKRLVKLVHLIEPAMYPDSATVDKETMIMRQTAHQEQSAIIATIITN